MQASTYYAPNFLAEKLILRSPKTRQNFRQSWAIFLTQNQPKVGSPMLTGAQEKTRCLRARSIEKNIDVVCSRPIPAPLFVANYISSDIKQN